MGMRPNVHLSAKDLIELGMCPFADERYALDIDDPCPICGETGREWEDKCIGNGTRKENTNG